MNRLSRFFFRHLHAKALEEQLNELVSRVNSYEQAFSWAAEEDIVKQKEAEKKKFRQMENDIQAIKDFLEVKSTDVARKTIFSASRLSLLPGQYEGFIRAVFEEEVEITSDIATTVKWLDREIDRYRSHIGIEDSMNMSDLDCLRSMDSGVEY